MVRVVVREAGRLGEDGTDVAFFRGALAAASMLLLGLARGQR